LGKKDLCGVLVLGFKDVCLLGVRKREEILLFGSVVIISQAIPRVIDPQPVNRQGMFYLAIAGIMVNSLAMFRLKGGHSQNEKVISIHLLEDVLGWVAVLIASIVMRFADLPIIDPILSLTITAFILFRVFGSIRQTFRIFMQAIPSKDQIEQIKEQLSAIEDIVDIHDIHFWTLDGTYNVASLHISVNPEITVLQSEVIRQQVRTELKKQGFEHSTIEVEPVGNHCDLHNC